MKKNKITYILLCFAIALCACFFVGCGKDDQETKQEIDSQGVEYELTENGKSYNVINFISNGTKSIEIPSEYNKKPVTSVNANAFANQSQVEYVLLGNNITSIGASAFKGCSALKQIDFSDSVTQIGESAFENSALESVTFGEGLKKISQSAFKNCSKLNVVELNSALETIEKDAFNGDNLSSLLISENVKKLGQNCFANNTYLNYVTVQNEEIDENELKEAFSINQNIIHIAISSKYLISFSDFAIEELEVVLGTSVGANLFQAKSSLKSVSLCDTITKIGNNSFKNCNNLTTLSCGTDIVQSFDCSNIKELSLTSGTKVMGGTFNTASNLITLSLANTITEIENDCFNGGIVQNLTCSADVLSYFNQENIISLNIVSGETIKKSDFLNMSNLEKLSLSNTITEIENGAFDYCSKLVYDENEIGYYIDNWLVKVTNKNIEDLSEKDNLMIVNKALDGCNNLKKLRINTLKDKLSVLFNENISPVLEELSISSGILVDNALKDVKSLKIIELQNVTEIGDSAFEGCENLETLNINSNIEKMGENVFDFCGKLKFEEYSGGRYVSNVFISVLDTKSPVVAIREGTKFLYNNSFRDCSNLLQVYIPSSVTNVGNEIFYGCNDELRIYIQNANCKILNKSNEKWNYNSDEHELSVYTSVEFEGGYIYLSNGSTCTVMGYMEQSSIIYIPQELNGMSVTEIAPYAFYCRDDIETLIMSDNIEVVGSYAFMMCENIDNVIMSIGLKYINQYAFYGCSNIKSFELNKNIVEIRMYAFACCYSLSMVFANGTNMYAQKGAEDVDLSSATESELAQCLCNYSSYIFVNKGNGEIVK